MTERTAPRIVDEGDEGLVDAARVGDRGAFDELYRRHAPLVRAVLLARLRYQEVPDLIQDVFLTAWTRLTTLREGRAFAAWVVTIARNRAHAHARQRIALTELHEMPNDSAPAAEALEALDAIATLPDAYRETLLLRFVEGMTGPEIAARTGMTHGSVRVNLHRGMKLLRERLQLPDGKDRSS